MKLHEYNEMMSYVLRRPMSMGGFIERLNLGQGGTSKILPLLNKEAQKVYGKNWPELDADTRQKISGRVRARIVSEKKKVDPAKNKNILRQKETEKKLKDFAAKFKKENGRPPMITEITEEVGTAYEQIKKYLKKSEYATPQQALKFKKQVEVRDIPDEMTNWFKKNYPGKDWKKDLTINERGIAKEKFKNRNNPLVLSRDEYKKLDDFLQKRKNQGKTLFKGGLEDIAKEAGTDLTPLQTGKYITSRFPGEFVYRGTKIGEVPKIRQRVAELAKTLSDKQIYEKLVEEKLINPSGAAKSADYKSVKNLMKDLQEEGKIKNIIKNPRSQFTPQEEKFRDNLIKEFVNKNPDVDNANAIAKGINAVNPELRISSNFVKNSVDRQNLRDFIQSRHKKIFSDVKALDKIIKSTPELKTTDKISGALKENILAKYAAATGKDTAKAEGELVSRMRKLGHLYAGQEQRYEPELYSKIKPPKNYLNTKFQRNFINLTSQSGAISNISMAKLLGLPKADQTLIQGTANMMSAFDFSVAGDHTDIKSMMKDFPNYKKNFSRIEYIKDNLNEFKRTYDIQINNLRKQAELVSGPAQFNLLEKANKLQDEFNRRTGYRIGSFDINKGRVTINPQTLRLPDIKNPYNETLQQAMENFETTKNPKLGSIAATKPEKFTGLDKRLINASASERAKIFKDVQGTKAAKESLYLKALQKVPKIGKIATAVIGGTAGAAAITTLSQADEPGAETPDDFPTGKVAAGAAAAPLATKKGRSIYGKAAKQIARGVGKTLAVGALPLEAGFVLSDLKSGASTPEALANIFLLGGAVKQKEKKDFISNKYGPEVYAQIQSYKSFGEDGMDMPQELPDQFQAIELEADQFVEDERTRRAEEFARQTEEDRSLSLMPESMTEGLYALGGRVGFAEGPKDPSRRKFIKIMGGLASLPIVGKYFKLAEKAAPVVQQLKNTTTTMPEWFPSFIDKVINRGVGKKIDADLMEYEVKELPGIKVTKSDDGRVFVEGKNDYYKSYEIDYTPPGYEVIDEKTGKAVKRPGDFMAQEEVPVNVDPDGNADFDAEVLEDLDQILGSDTRTMEEFATGKSVKGMKSGEFAVGRAEAQADAAKDFDDFYED